MPRVSRVRNKKRVSRSRPKAIDVLERIRPMNADASGIHICLYGKSGTGKTTLWGTFPGKILAILCSGGKTSRELKSLNTPEHKKKIDEVILHSPEESVELAEYAAQTGNYATVVLDHLTNFQDLVLADVLGLDTVPEQLSWGLATQQQYGQVSLQMKTYLRTLLDLSCNVVLVAQERVFLQDEDAVDRRIDPHVGCALSPSLDTWIQNNVENVCQTLIRRKIQKKETIIRGKKRIKEIDTGDVEYCLRVSPDSIYSSKFRSPKEKTKSRPKFIVDPTYDKLMKLM